MSRAALLLLAGSVLAGLWLVPRGYEAIVLLARDDPAQVVAYQLAPLGPADYAGSVAAALDGDDADLAASLTTLAASQGVELPPALLERVDAAVASGRAQAPQEAWRGFLSGKAPTEAALAGATAADLTGFGDLRDLLREGRATLAGEPADTVTLGLAAVGLTLTGATFLTLGAAVPAHAGVTTLKAAYRAGRISPPLRAQLAALSRQAIDRDALKGVMVGAKRLNPAAARRSAANVLRPAPAAALRQLGDDIATLGGRAGYRGTLQVLDTARSTGQVHRAARVAGQYGRGTRGVLAMLGAGMFSAAWTLVSVLFWVVALAAWAAAFVYIAARFLWRALRAIL